MAVKVRDFEVRLTKNKEERKQVRQLRYRVFIDEDGGTPTEEQKILREEYDDYDKYAQYMGVFHNGQVIATYRIINEAAAEKMGGFYSEIEFDISKIKRVNGNIAEMSRACVAPEYRENSLAIRLMWLGLGEYIAKNKISLLFGMASWFNVTPMQYAMATSYLYYNHLAPLSLRGHVDLAKLSDGIDPKLTRMNILPRAFVDKDAAYAQMGAVLKGYLRLGAQLGNGVSISNDALPSYSILVIMQTKNISRTYQKRFAGNENAFDDLGVKDGAIKTLGKIMLFPVTGPWRIMRTFAEYLLRDDAADAEYVEDKAESDE